MAGMNTPQDLIGAEVIDRNGERIGKVGNVYLSDHDQQPQWITVHTGLFGLRESFLPLQGARLSGSELHVTTTKDMVKEAPQLNDADGHLSESQGMELYRYYGVPTGRRGNTAPKQEQARQSTMTAEPPQAPGQRRPQDDTMVRSEERLRVGTEQVESGRVRLRKYVVTEEQRVNVPLRHEEVRIEREPVTSGGVDAKNARIGEAEQEVVLHAERPVVQTEAVPVEKVRLNKETVTDQRTVSGQVRKERIDVDRSRDGKNR